MNDDILHQSPDKQDIIGPLIGVSLMCLGWVSSGPEIWKRLTTLPRLQMAKQAILGSAFIIPVIFFIPMVWLIVSGITVSPDADQTAAYDVWKELLTDQGPYVVIFVLCAMVTALFTTIDTYLITYGQLMESFPKSPGRKMISLVSSNNPRAAGPWIIIAALLIGTQIGPRTLATLGCFGFSLVIPMFFIIHVHPFFKKSFPKAHIRPWFSLLPPVLSLWALYPVITHPSPGFPPYQYFAISMFCMHSLILLIYMIVLRFRKEEIK